MIPGSGRFAGEGIGYPLQYCWASLVAQLVKNLPILQKTCIRSLGWDDPLGKGKATYSSILTELLISFDYLITVSSSVFFFYVFFQNLGIFRPYVSFPLLL